MQTTRRTDMRVDSEAISPFLDFGFYYEMECRYGVQCQRQTSLDMQYRGVDVVIESRRGESYIDEKVKVDNINDPPTAYAFELSSIQRDTVWQGWFVGKDIITTHYLIGCVFSKNADKRTLRREEIDYISASLVLKSDIVNWLVNHGVTNDKLVALDADIRQNPNKYRVYPNQRRTFRIQLKETDKVWLTYSAWLNEAPINLSVPTAILDNLPNSRRYVISKNGFTELGKPLSATVLEAQVKEEREAVSRLYERVMRIETRLGIKKW